MPRVLNPHELPACMIGPSKPCNAFTILYEKLSRTEAVLAEAQKVIELVEFDVRDGESNSRVRTSTMDAIQSFIKASK